MITTHVLDISNGKPAASVHVSLARFDDGRRTPIADGVTDADGRLRDLTPTAETLDTGIFELTFDTGTYFRTRGVEPLHPRIVILVELTEPGEHYHIPVLVSPYGYTTYRGS